MITLNMLDRICFEVLRNMGPTDTEYRAVVSFKQFCELRMQKHNDTRGGWDPENGPPNTLRWGPWLITAVCAEVSYVELWRKGYLYATLPLPRDPTARLWSSL